jgi:hypothetical protein
MPRHDPFKQFSIRKLVMPPLPNEFEIIKSTISRKSMLFGHACIDRLTIFWMESLKCFETFETLSG